MFKPKTILSLLISLLICFSFPVLAGTKSVVYIYDDEGASRESVSQARTTLIHFLSPQYAIRAINAKDIIKNQWIKDAALLVMPGGADLPYVKKLNGPGNRNIKNYVAHGGAYLGLCAGAYYASHFIEFDKGGPLQVVGYRQLAFFPGTVKGPILAPYDYQSNLGARAAVISLTVSPKKTAVYYNGGGYFAHAQQYPRVTILGYYKNKLPAIIAIRYHQGKVILSGVHVEYNPLLLDPQDPYLIKIIPVLRQYDASRQALVKRLLTLLLS